MFFKDSSTLLLHTSAKIDFWQTLSTITSYPINNHDQKLWLLKEHKIAISNIIKESNLIPQNIEIEDEKTIDIDSILNKYSNIKKIICIGKKAQKLYQINFDYLDIDTSYISSSNKISFDNKIKLFKKELGR